MRGGGNNLPSSISRRTRSQIDVYYRNLHEELKKSRLQAASSSGIDNVASNVEVNGDGNGGKQDSGVDSSKTVISAEVSVFSRDDDSDRSAEHVRLVGDLERSTSSCKGDSDDYSDFGENSDEYTMSPNNKRARKTVEMQGTVQKGRVKEACDIISDEEEEYSSRRNKNKRKTAEEGERRKPGRTPKTKKKISDDEDSDDEFTLKKSGRPPKEKACGKSKQDVIDQLVDSIWKQKDLVDKAALVLKKKAPYQSSLPLKFRFEDSKLSIPEKSDKEKELDSLLSEMEIAMWEPEAECTNSSMVY